MVGILNIDVRKSSEKLKELLSGQSRVVEQSQVQILWWLQSGPAIQVNELVRLSGYHRTTVSSWFSPYRQGGLAQLHSRSQSSGRLHTIAGDRRSQSASD